MASSNGSSPRKRGAQPGNANALKHGFYSRTYFSQIIERIENDPCSDLADEEALLRMLIFRAVKPAGERALSHAEHVIILRAVSLAVGRIIKIQRSRKSIENFEAALPGILEFLHGAPQDKI